MSGFAGFILLYGQFEICPLAPRNPRTVPSVQAAAPGDDGVACDYLVHAGAYRRRVGGIYRPWDIQCVQAAFGSAEGQM
jgi:hypothetical protein